MLICIYSFTCVVTSEIVTQLVQRRPSGRARTSLRYNVTRNNINSQRNYVAKKFDACNMVFADNAKIVAQTC